MAAVLALILMAAAACVPVAVPTPVSASAAATAAPAAAPASSSTITGVVWQWTSVTDQTTKKTDTVPAPQNYTLTFNPDGTLTGKADCNNFAGTYSQSGGFTIKITTSTQAYCGEASLDTKYLSLLSQVAAGGPDGQGNLALETAGGAQRMLFKNGAPAAPSSTITGIVWQWVSVIDQTTNKTTTVPDPQNYTITFNPDGTLTGKANCNNFSGVYSQSNGFPITIGATTRAYCSPDSLDQQYLSALNQVAAGGPDGRGNLALENAGGQLRMLFRNGGPAPK
jgi:heat shock protein HslJ